MSSPSVERFGKSIKAIRQNLARVALQEIEFQLLKQQIEEQNKKKISSRRSLKTGGALEASWAIQKKREKRVNKKANTVKTAQKALNGQIKKAINTYHEARVTVRRTNRLNKKEVTRLR